MNERLRRAAGSPGWQLVLAGALLALLFPADATGTVGLMIVAGGLGVAVALAWPQAPTWLRTPPSDLTTMLVITIVIAAGITTFWDTLTTSPDWPLGDWGPQHAVLANVIDASDPPVWNHKLSTGDAPLELYPAMTYTLVGYLARMLGLTGDLAHALMIAAVLVHVAIAAMTTLIAMRIAPKPLALLVGLVAIVDSGAIAHGGTVGLFRWALLHSALALAFSAAAAVGVLATLHRPRVPATLLIWIATALATATHPAGLLSAAAAMVGLVVVALLAADVPARRPLIAIGHLLVGVALGASMWMPLGERIVEYGQHFPNAIRAPQDLLQDLLAAPSPVTSYALLGYAGYAGIVAGLWSRRAPLVFVSAVSIVLLVGLCDAPYLALDVAPGQTVARLGTERLAQLARPFLHAAGAFGIALVARAALTGWNTASTRHRLVAAALVGILTAAMIRVVPWTWSAAVTRASSDARAFAPDAEGRALLRQWARAQVRSLGPNTWARALFEQDTHEQMHLTAETGLPTLHDRWLPDLLLRERIEDLSEASVRRFNIRWVIGVDKSPTLGDPATEIRLGNYRIRTLPAWDGKFARIERGTGDVTVHRLDDHAVEIEVTGTTEPVLVALGTGFYPRWQARHGSGTPEPVYALPATEGGRLHVVSAWVAPGRTTFTVDGPLPSDGKGTLVSVLALLAAIASTIAWLVPRARRRILRVLARGHRRLPPLGAVARIGVPLLMVVLFARGCLEARGITTSLELGTGIRATATVEARDRGGAWQTCGYNRAEGVHACDRIAYATDGIASLLNDATPSWAFNTPAIVVHPDAFDAEVRIRLRARLAGTYWAAASDGKVTLEVSGEEQQVFARDVLVYADAGERDVEIRAALPAGEAWSFTMVHESTLLPKRAHLVPPPAQPPASVIQIAR